MLAGLVVMVLAAGELPVSFLTAPPGYRTIAGLFFDSLHYGLADETAALCLISIFMVFGPCAGFFVLLRQGRVH
jgi:ABC-type spermidine/putrescine transport system permease subunit II